MREKLETLPVVQLREFAKAQGLKCSGLKKNELIDLLCEAAEKKPENKPQEIHSAAAVSVSEAEAKRTEKENRFQNRQHAARNGQNRKNNKNPSNQNAQTNQSSARPKQNRRPHEIKEDTSAAASAEKKINETETVPAADTPVKPETASAVKPEVKSDEPSPAVKAILAALSRDEIPVDQRTNRPLVSLEVGEQRAEILAADSGVEANGILEILAEGYGFIRCENFLPGERDVYVAPSQIRRFNLKTGDIIRGHRRKKTTGEKFASLLYLTSVNGYPAIESERRPNFEDLTPVFPNERIRLEEGQNAPLPLRVTDLLAPIGKGQRGMIVSPPKAGKTTLLKQIAKSIIKDKKMHLIILLIDERPEEVTDIKEEVVGENVEVIYSTFDELPERHKRVSEMVIERAKRLVEYGRDVTILLDSITRLARAYNLVVPPSGRTLSGGLDPAALHMPKRFFGAARNMREGGSLTILATALIETGSRMDDVIYEEFKGTGNMELVLDRKLSEKRIFPAIDILKSGTRRDDLLLTPEEMRAVNIVRGSFGSLKPEESASSVLDLFAKTRDNTEFVRSAEKIKYF